MTAPTPEDMAKFAQLFEMFSKHIDKNADEKHKCKKTLGKDFIKEMGSFEGEEEAYMNWAFKWKVGVKSESMGLLKVIEAVEMRENEVDIPSLKEEFKDEDISKLSTELYEALVRKLDGHATTSLKNVQDMNGFEVWRVLRKECNPTSPVMALKALVDVVTTKKVKSEKELGRAIDELEVKMNRIARDHGETIGPKLKIAIVASLCPIGLVEAIYQHISATTTYEDFRKKLKALIENRVAISMPQPMDLGNVDSWDEDWRYGGFMDQEVNWMGKAGSKGSGKSCFNCGAKGHFARECPMTGKGKGKGEEPKGGGKGGGFSWKGEGKGGMGKGAWMGGKAQFNGYCNGCGKWGHRIADCRVRTVNELESETAEEHGREVSNVDWEVFHVMKEQSAKTTWTKVEGKTVPKTKVMKPFVTRNTFELLAGRAEPEAHKVEMNFGNVARIVTKPMKQKRKKCEDVQDILCGTCCEFEVGVGPKEINAIETGLVKKRSGKVTVDSGAEESVWPATHANWREVHETEESRKGIGFVAANGSRMENYGCTKIQFGQNDIQKSMNF